MLGPFRYKLITLFIIPGNEKKRSNEELYRDYLESLPRDTLKIRSDNLCLRKIVSEYGDYTRVVSPNAFFIKKVKKNLIGDG